MKRARSLFAVFTLAACATREGPPVAAPETLTAAQPIEAAAPGRSLASRPAVHAWITAPATVPYLPVAGGLGGHHIRLHLANTGRVAVPVPRPHVTFAATRNGVPFPCKHDDVDAIHDREPAQLEPGGAFTYERDIDCALTVTGRYDVSAWLRFAGEAAPGEAIGTFPLEIVGNGHGVPHPIAGRPLLYAGIAGETTVHPMPPDAWRRGDYHVVVFLVNTGPTPVVIAPLHASLRVTSKARPIACAPELTEARAAGVTLRPGHAYTIPVALRCALALQGEYEIAGLVMIGDAEGTAPLEIGRMRLRVTESTELLPLLEDRLELRR